MAEKYFNYWTKDLNGARVISLMFLFCEGIDIYLCLALSNGVGTLTVISELNWLRHKQIN